MGMKKSHEVLKQVITQCGAKVVASELGLSQSMIYKWCQSSEGETSSGADNPLDRLLEICRASGNEAPIDWLCQQTGSFRVKNPAPTDSAAPSVVDNIQTILKEFSELLEAVTESYDNELRIDEGESARIRKEWEELKSVTEQFVLSCEAGVFDPQRKK